MSRLRTAIALPLLVAFLALAPSAGAEYLIPPGNSAATQYTEAVPTPGGPRASDPPGGRSGRPSPGRVLGAKNVERLADRGAVGRAAAETVAASAPQALLASPPSTSGERARRGSGSSGRESGTGAGQGAGGSSQLGSVLGQATGSSAAGGLGLLLPLVVFATAIWAAAFLAGRRGRSPA